MKTYIHRSGRNFACMEAAIVKGPYLPCKGFSWFMEKIANTAYEKVKRWNEIFQIIELWK